MADSMGVHCLRHTRARLAGELERLKTSNSRYAKSVATLNDLIAPNELRIREIGVQIEALGEAARLGFSVGLSAPEPWLTYRNATSPSGAA